jgi:hypothetical protein
MSASHHPITPTISGTAFSCAHCRALAKQFWYSIGAKRMGDGDTPSIITSEEAENIANLDESEAKDILIIWAKRAAQGTPFLAEQSSSQYISWVNNVYISQCYNCSEISLWMYNRIIYPYIDFLVLPNPDLPESSKIDYLEAASILSASPRGAAALLRLCIQKLCAELGEAGKNINDDIASLVKKGLDVRIQQALDVVRVVGNNAVHPGKLDLRDDRSTAEQLFTLVNLIADVMISQPKHIARMYGALPEKARAAVERRDRSVG